MFSRQPLDERDGTSEAGSDNTDFQSNQSLSCVELGAKLSTGLDSSMCSVAVFPASSSSYSAILFSERCPSNLGVRRAGPSQLGLSTELQGGRTQHRQRPRLQGCPGPAALGLPRGSGHQSRQWRWDWGEGLGIHGRLSGRQAGA